MNTPRLATGQEARGLIGVGHRMGRRRVLGLFAVLALACTRRVDPKEPPAISYGRDVCSRCGMIISEPASAAAHRTAAGEVRLFDDLGEMVIYQHERQEEIIATFVHDYGTRAWLAAEDGYYVQSSKLRTPMGFGVVAFAAEADARALASQVDGKLVRWQDLNSSSLPMKATSAEQSRPERWRKNVDGENL